MSCRGSLDDSVNGLQQHFMDVAYARHDLHYVLLRYSIFFFTFHFCGKNYHSYILKDSSSAHLKTKVSLLLYNKEVSVIRLARRQETSIHRASCSLAATLIIGLGLSICSKVGSPTYGGNPIV